jgi:aspartyl/asparaginyl beta-hydroxylase (cupin superfamily)
VQLGGVLITKLPPGGEITPHVDGGWHAEYYDKYLVPIQNEKGAVFCYNDIELQPKDGEIYGFRNDVQHWVKNESNSDRIVMVVCVKQDRYSKEGLCLGDMQ